MMEFPLAALHPEPPNLSLSEPARNFSYLETLVAQLGTRRGSFLTPLSLPFYTDEVTPKGELIVTHNFID